MSKGNNSKEFLNPENQNSKIKLDEMMRTQFQTKQKNISKVFSSNELIGSLSTQSSNNNIYSNSFPNQLCTTSLNNNQNLNSKNINVNNLSSNCINLNNQNSVNEINVHQCQQNGIKENKAYKNPNEESLIIHPLQENEIQGINAIKNAIKFNGSQSNANNDNFLEPYPIDMGITQNNNNNPNGKNKNKKQNLTSKVSMNESMQMAADSSSLQLPILPEDIESINSQEFNQENHKIFTVMFKNEQDFISNAGEYLEDIYNNLLEDEKTIFIKPRFGYMSIQSDINEQMRAILVDWMVEVHFRFNLRQETLFQAIWIVDAYLSILPIGRHRLQLLGIAALFISSKKNEMITPKKKEFTNVTDGAYKVAELLEMEKHVLTILNYSISAPISLEFYDILAKAFNFDQNQYFLGKYFLESSLIDYDMIKYSASVTAVSCIYIVMKFFGLPEYKKLYSKDFTNENCPQKAIKDSARDICFLVKNLSASTLLAVQKKYSLPQFNCVTKYCTN